MQQRSSGRAQAGARAGAGLHGLADCRLRAARPAVVCGGVDDVPARVDAVKHGRGHLRRMGARPLLSLLSFAEPALWTEVRLSAHAASSTAVPWLTAPAAVTSL